MYTRNNVLKLVALVLIYNHITFEEICLIIHKVCWQYADMILFNKQHQVRLSSSVMNTKGLPKRLFHDCYKGQTILYFKVRSLLLYSFLIYNYHNGFMFLCNIF